MKQFSIGIIILATLGSSLLIGNSLHLRALGGDGFVKYPTIQIEGQPCRRGCTYTFSEDKLVQIGSGLIWGEKGTELQVEDTRTDSFRIRMLSAGRIVTKNTTPLTVEVNKLSLQPEEGTELIHYSWLNELEITKENGEHEKRNTETGDAL